MSIVNLYWHYAQKRRKARAKVSEDDTSGLRERIRRRQERREKVQLVEDEDVDTQEDSNPS